MQNIKRMKYKIKIDKIYIRDKQIMISYKLYCKYKQKEYSLCAMGANITIKDFLIYWYQVKIKREFNIRF